MKGPLTHESWKSLPSRPIRAAETDPIRCLSEVLKTLLKELLDAAKQKLVQEFTILNGCEDYINRLGNIQIDDQKQLRTTFITADFADAYTSTSITHIQKSVLELGSFLNIHEDHISLMTDLIHVVFTNCYFDTPKGIYYQTLGMPMGDVSSRDALDVDLLCSEIKVLQKLQHQSIKMQMYSRLVDDISVIYQGDFKVVKIILHTMAMEYPDMVLNVQLSFGYSRFLDLHIHNNLSTKTITHSLAYKTNSSFQFTPSDSNIHRKYKHSIMPIYLHRIFTRCVENSDKNHHLKFMNEILKFRNQNPTEVCERTHHFFKNRKNKNKKQPYACSFKTTPVVYDRSSKRHQIVADIIRRSTKNLRVVYNSMPKLTTILCSKRRVNNILPI